MSNISIRNLRKRFGAKVALDGLSLEIRDCEFLVMVGPTGAGKTTTLRCVAGLETLDEGQILIDGQDVARVSPAARDVAFVFQNYALSPRKTVAENMAFPLQARRYSPAEVEANVRRVAAMLRIDHLLERRPAQLSGGEQQRVALGRAMVRTPRAFLMDEPLTNLDFQLRAQMRSELKRIQQELNTTFFYVTNDQVEALSMGDRVAVLHRGVLQQVGPPQEVYGHPANLFVAGFVGSTRMNFLPCAFDGDQGAVGSRESGWSVRLSERLRRAVGAAKDPGRLVLGVRPEDVQLLAGEGEADLAGRVYVVEPLGDRNIHDVQVGAELIKVKTPPTFALEPGAAAALRLDMERAHLFDAVTELALA